MRTLKPNDWPAHKTEAKKVITDPDEILAELERAARISPDWKPPRPREKVQPAARPTDHDGAIRSVDRLRQYLDELAAEAADLRQRAERLDRERDEILGSLRGLL